MARTRFELAPLGRFLDPRPAVEVAAGPFADAASIPFDELNERLFELPPKNEEIAILGDDRHAKAATEFLREGGRAVTAARPTPAPEFAMHRLWKPNAFLCEVLPSLDGETAIDMACGNGREASALAAAGYAVDACDHAAEALENGRQLARRYLRGQSDGEPVHINWRRIDLVVDGPPPRLYDLAVSLRFLHRPLLQRMWQFITPGGSLVVETFTAEHRARHGKPRSDAFVLAEGELPRLAEKLEVQHYDEGWRNDGSHTAQMWAKRPC